MSMRPFRALAADLGYTERTFHRKLDAGDPAACLALRQEVVWDNQPTFANTCNFLNDTADLVKRCDPKLSSLCEAMAAEISKFLECEPSKFRHEHDKRLSELALIDHVSDEDYERWAADLEHLPPLASELKTKRKSASDALHALVGGTDPAQPV